MAISCDGNGQIDLETIINAVNQNESSLQNQKLDDHSDVDTTGVQNDYIIKYDAQTQMWIASEAPNPQIQSDWNQTDNTQPDFIKNKPDMNNYEPALGNPSQDGMVLSSDTNGNRSWVIDSSETNLSYEEAPNYGKILNDSGTDATIPIATQTMAGLMSASDKSSLDRLVTNIDGGTYT